ncbi:MAG: hypothetical protein WBM68_08720, partial [Woeseia sp.]
MKRKDRSETAAAGNGLLDRRFFLQTGLTGGIALLSAQALGKEREPWMTVPGAAMSESGEPAPQTAHIRRINVSSQPGTTGTGVSR